MSVRRLRERAVAHIERLWSGPAREECLLGLSGLRTRLGEGGAISRIADRLVEDLDIGRRRQTRMYGHGLGATTEG